LIPVNGTDTGLIPLGGRTGTGRCQTGGMRNHQQARIRTVRRSTAVAAVLVAGALGTAVGIPALTSDGGPASPSPAAASPAPETPSRRYTSADAAEHRAAAAARARLEVCTANPISADGLEHCIEGGR
jgi:hypothetical protein